MVGGAGHTGENRVIRGGSWNDLARNVRAAYRNANPPGNRNSNLGLRLARAQRQVGWPVADPPRHLSARLRPGGEHGARRRCARSPGGCPGECSPAPPFV